MISGAAHMFFVKLFFFYQISIEMIAANIINYKIARVILGLADAIPVGIHEVTGKIDASGIQTGSLRAPLRQINTICPIHLIAVNVEDIFLFRP